MQLNKFKTVLQNEKEEILIFMKNNRQNVDFDGDETDEIQAKIIAHNNAAILAKKQEKLRKIEAAIKKIESGKYGECEACGEEIAEKRLLFNPGFNTCISCQEGLDRIRRSQA